MSDLAAAAAALGLPEALVQRSADARAAETGSSADEILAAWAGGGSAPAPAAPAPAPAEEPAAPPDEAVDEAAPSEAAAPEPAITLPEAAAPVAAAPAGPYKPPVLIGARDNPANVMLGAIGLFLIVLLVGLVGPSIPFDEPGARTSEIPYSTVAQEGQVLYESQGCNACHTQLVRPVVADVGLGAVTLNDSNQVIGTRRFGPDLSDVGSRYTTDELAAIVAGDLGDHPPYGLGDDDMAAVVAYLAESRTSG